MKVIDNDYSSKINDQLLNNNSMIDNLNDIGPIPGLKKTDSQQERELFHRQKLIFKIGKEMDKALYTTYEDLWDMHVKFSIQKSYNVNPFSIKPEIENSDYERKTSEQEMKRFGLHTKHHGKKKGKSLNFGKKIDSNFTEDFECARNIVLTLIALNDISRAKNYIKPFMYAGHLIHLNKLVVQNLTNFEEVENPFYVKIEFRPKKDKSKQEQDGDIKSLN